MQTELRCALRNGSAWAPESLSYVQYSALVIDEQDWKTQRKVYYRDFDLPVQVNHFLQQRLDRLECGLRGVSEAVQRNSLLIDNRGVHVEKLRALDEDRWAKTAGIHTWHAKAYEIFAGERD